MAEVSQRIWRVPGTRTKRKAWGYSLMVNGRQVRSYKSEWTKEDAERELAKLKLGIAVPPAPPSITFGQACARYLSVKARKKSLAEITRILDALKVDFGAETPLTDLTSARVSEWKSQRLAAKSRQTGEALSAASINRPLATLRALLRMAHEEWEALDKLPKIKLEREPEGRARWLTVEEATRLLDACRESRNPALVDLVEFSLFTGLRQAEALGLDWNRVDRSRGVILLEITKSGRRREVPLNDGADAVLVRRGPKEEGLVFGARSFDHFRSAWERALTRAKLMDFRFHDLRHTYASWLVQKRVTLLEVKDLLGHASLAMTKRYSHLAPEHLRQAAASLDGVLSSPEAGLKGADDASDRESSAQTQRKSPSESVSPVGVSQKSL